MARIADCSNQSCNRDLGAGIADTNDNQQRVAWIGRFTRNRLFYCPASFIKINKKPFCLLQADETALVMWCLRMKEYSKKSIFIHDFDIKKDKMQKTCIFQDI